MTYRRTSIRTVDQNGDNTVQCDFWLWHAAIAAAEETIQGIPLSRAWLGLFEEHLSRENLRLLRWGQDLAESTEMRRAYSAIYGRFFSRGFLACKLGISEFFPLSGDATPFRNGEATVHRNNGGDMPDWIAWDRAAGSYVLAEAKGRLTGSTRAFLNGEPDCVRTGRAQFNRVQVRNSHCQPIRTSNWVAANLWSTDERDRQPIALLWNSDNIGDDLDDAEKTVHAAALQEHRTSSIWKGLGFRESQTRDSLTVTISIEPSNIVPPPEPPPKDVPRQDSKDTGMKEDLPIKKTSTERHSDEYIAALITRLGIRPILHKTDIDAVRSVQDTFREDGEAAMVYGLSTRLLSEAYYRGELWLSGGGIVSTDGAALFDLKQIELE